MSRKMTYYLFWEGKTIGVYLNYLSPVSVKYSAQTIPFKLMVRKRLVFGVISLQHLNN